MTLGFSSVESARIRDSVAIYNYRNPFPDSGYQPKQFQNSDGNIFWIYIQKIYYNYYGN